MQSPNEYEHGYINANAARVSEETPELSLHKPEMLRRCTDPLNPPAYFWCKYANNPPVSYIIGSVASKEESIVSMREALARVQRTLDHRPYLPPDAHSSGEPREIPSSEARANVILALADLRRAAARLEAALMDYSGPEEILTESESETVVEPPGDLE